MTYESSTQVPARTLRVVIAGGGTGGHISPAIAVAHELRRRTVVELQWIGSDGGFERRAAKEHAIPFHTVSTGKLRRYFSWTTLADVFRVPYGVYEARKLLKQLQPDVIFSTGGFVSVPTVAAGRLCGIPSLTHEQTASLGLATRINARFCDVVALSYPGTTKISKRKDAEIVITGNPVRPSITNGDRRMLLTLFDIPENLPLLYVTGGAQGAHALNEIIAAALPSLLDQVAVIHQCGPQSGNGDHRRMLDLRDKINPAQRVRYHPVERVGDELAHIYAGAALVIGRAGAGTVAELSALGLPSLLVPLPGADEQMRNAELLSHIGAAVIMRQDGLTAEMLAARVTSLVRDEDKLTAMRAAALSIAPQDPVSRLSDALIALAGTRS